MQRELERRLLKSEEERSDDPAFVDLPMADRRWLAALFIAALLGVAIMQAL